MSSSTSTITTDVGHTVDVGARIRLDPRRGGTKPCPHCGMTPPQAHGEGCIAPKMRPGAAALSAKTLNQWKAACATAFPEQNHDGVCKQSPTRRR